MSETITEEKKRMNTAIAQPVIVVPSSSTTPPTPPVPPMQLIEAENPNFFSKYKWYLLGALGIAVLVTVGGVVFYRVYYPGNESLSQTQEQKNNNSDSLVLIPSSTDNNLPNETTSTEMAVAPNSTSTQSENSNGAANSGGSAGGGAGVTNSQNNGGNVAQQGGGGGAVPPQDGGALPPANDQQNNQQNNQNQIVPGVQGGSVNVVIPNQGVVNVDTGSSANVAVQDNNVVPNQNVSDLQAQNAITVSLDPNTPKTSLIKDESTSNLLIVKISATDKPLKITKLSFAFTNAKAFGLAGKVKVTAGGSTLESDSIRSLVKADLSFPNLNLNVNPGAPLTVSVALQSEALDNAGLSGTDVKLKFETADYVYNNKSYQYHTPVEGNSIYIYKSYPEISLSTLSTHNLVKGTNTFGSFHVNPVGGVVGWRSLAFNFTGKIENLKIGSNQASPVGGYNGIYHLVLPGGPGIAAGESPDVIPLITDLKLYRPGLNGILTQVGGTMMYIQYSDKVQVIFTANAEQQISSATSYVLQGNVLQGSSLKADSSKLVNGDNVNCAIYKVNTNMVSDTFLHVQHDDVPPSIVWSDLSAAAHSENSSDWHNEYLIPGIPTAAQTLTYTAPITVPTTTLTPIKPSL